MTEEESQILERYAAQMAEDNERTIETTRQVLEVLRRWEIEKIRGILESGTDRERAIVQELFEGFATWEKEGNIWRDEAR